MRCPVCDISLKPASHRGIVLSYCPVCGGTWLDRDRFGCLGTPGSSVSGRRRRLGRLAVVAAVVAGCLLATVLAIGLTVWPLVSGWVGTLSNGALPEASALGKTAAAALAAQAGYGALAASVAAVSGLGPLVESGAYLQVLKEARQQGLANLAELKTEGIAAPEVRAAAEQIQRALQAAPGIAGAVDPAVIRVLESREFELVRRSGLLQQLLEANSAQPRGPVVEGHQGR